MAASAFDVNRGAGWRSSPQPGIIVLDD